ncbi:MAG: C40 family peptidase [Treponema sp.]|jgi:hypothetical protein|nr:C40 family peptidase [Treponema sp.]
MLKIPPLLCCGLLLSRLWAQDLASALPETAVNAAAVTKTPAAAAAGEIPLPADAGDIPELDIEFLLRGRVAETARQYLGVSYKYAGITPEGFDCSGFVYFVFLEAAGMELSRSTVALWKSGKPVKTAEVKPGDLLIFTTVRPGASHVGIVLENSPDRGIIFAHAASQGAETGVIISGLGENYYKARYLGARSYF